MICFEHHKKIRVGVPVYTFADGSLRVVCNTCYRRKYKRWFRGASVKTWVAP